MKQLAYGTTLLLLLSMIIVQFSCRSLDEPTTSSDAKLAFSLDTLTFDTVFTTVGSATRILKLYNTNNRPIIVSNIKLENGNDSRFRINVDGISTLESSDNEIAANDSLYIFVEVTVNPDQDVSDSPFVIYENLLFETNGNDQKVVLEAWGQNAIYQPNGSATGTGGVVGLGCTGSTTWTNEKPIVIFGIVVIQDCNLIIEAGTQIYVHGGLQSTFVPAENMVDSVRVFYNDGRLIMGQGAKLTIEGTLEDPVVFHGDRLEEDFDEVAGQWFGIILQDDSATGHSIDHAVIKNAVFGVAVDSSADLTIRNSQVFNASGNGVLAIHSDVTAENCLFYDNGSSAFRAVQGGKYRFDNCTLASYGVDASALSLSDVRCLDPFCFEAIGNANGLDATFRNCIVFGSRSDELGLTNLSDATPFNYDFKNCILRVSEDALDIELYQDFLADCENCFNATNDDVIFFDVSENDYHLDTLSIAEMNAIYLPELPVDLDGNDRDMTAPDIGCFEYQY